MISNLMERQPYGVRLPFAVTDPRLDDRSALIAKSELFAGSSRAECDLLARKARAREFSPGQFLFEQDQTVRQVLLLESGCVKLTQISSNGREVILWLYGVGDAAGVLGSLAGFKHTCTASVVVNCRALVWDWSQLSAIADTALVQRNISGIVAKRLSKLEERFRELVTENVSRRLAYALVRIMKQVGHSFLGGIQIHLSREELAQLTGTTIYSVSRFISKWGDEGILIPRREAIIILDPNKLEQIAMECDHRDEE